MKHEGAYSVVIVTCNHAETLGACLDAVERLEPAPVKLVVVDNASADNSADIAASFAGKPTTEVLREKENTGFAAAANRGISTTSEPWVLLLNPDCAPSPDLPRCLLAAAAGGPETERIGSLSPKLLRGEGPNLEPQPVIDAAGMLVTCSGRHFDRGSGAPDEGSCDRPAWVFGGTAAAILYRRAALDDVAYPGQEYFAEPFFAYREDAELAWRLQLRDWRCLYAPSATAAHRRGFRPEEGRAGHREINRFSVRNRFLLRRHCADLAWHVHCFPGWLLRDMLVIGACLTVERSSLPGLIDVWRLRRDSKRRRSWVLGRRTVPTRRINAWFRRRGRVEEVEEA
ncbi:MAG: glycosyltransferase family 2 protein [Acidobacteria bacterium]|nr:glycosyltransferase family 2 protein [Acidobacteriota bacterium]